MNYLRNRFQKGANKMAQDYTASIPFDQSAPGFIQIWGLPVRTQAQAQSITEPAKKKGKH